MQILTLESCPAFSIGFILLATINLYFDPFQLMLSISPDLPLCFQWNFFYHVSTPNIITNASYCYSHCLPCEHSILSLLND